MQSNNNCKSELVEQIEQTNELIKELQYNQKEEVLLIKKNNEINMEKLNKIQEYNKMADISAQIFEARLTEMENALKEISKLLIN